MRETSLLDNLKKELKTFPSHLKYVFLEKDGNKLVVIGNFVSPKQERKLV